MRFLYVFGLMFLAIFGAVMLIEVFLRAIRDNACKSFDVYITADDDTEDFVKAAVKCPFIGRINIIGGEDSEKARLLAEKYENVRLRGAKLLYELEEKL